jgi:hypothetical protein
MALLKPIDIVAEPTRRFTVAIGQSESGNCATPEKRKKLPNASCHDHSQINRNCDLTVVRSSHHENI